MQYRDKEKWVDHWKWWKAHKYDLKSETVAELEWSVEQIKILEQSMLLANTFRALESIEQLQGLTWASRSATGKPTYPLGYADESIFLKQTSFLHELMFLEMPNRFSVTFKMSGWGVFK